jgi:hypothetical protein
MEMDNEMMFKDIDKYEQDDMNDDMNNRLNNEDLEDVMEGQMNQLNNNDLLQNEAQSLFSHEKDNNKLNHKLPMVPTSSLNLEGSKAPSKINQYAIHPWINQHSRHHYRDPVLMGNRENLAGKLLRTHKQQNVDRWGHYDDTIGSELTSWDGGTKDTSGSYEDIYGDMPSEYKEPYDGINDINKGYKESYGDYKSTTDGTFRATEDRDNTYTENGNGGTVASMYNDIDTNTYPKQPDEDNTGYIDTTLVGHSHDSKGLHGINGLSPEGRVGLPIQEYADELGQVRGLESSQRNKDKIKDNKKPKTKR